MGKSIEKEAKEKYKDFLEKSGEYKNVEITNTPADIIAEKEGKKFYFEIKATSTKKNIGFWGVTLPEWLGFIDNTERYMFVLAIKKNGKYRFVKLSPKEILDNSTIPPFRSTFRYILNEDKLKEISKTKSVKLNLDRINRMKKLYSEFESEK